MRPFLLLLLTLVSLPLEAVYQVKREGRPVEDRETQLDQGKILTEGGYLEGAVWGKMEAVIEAPPERVWRLYIRANDWTGYGIPFLIDSRAVGEAMVEEISRCRRVRDVYAVLNGADPLARRRPAGSAGGSGLWTNHVFQYINVKWPLKNRWVLLENRHDERRAAHAVFRSAWKDVAGDMRLNEGTILLEPFQENRTGSAGGGRTRLVYEIRAHPGSFVPKFLLKMAVKKSMPEAVQAIRAALQRDALLPPVGRQGE